MPGTGMQIALSARLSLLGEQEYSLFRVAAYP